MLSLVIERLLFVLKEGVGWRAIHGPDVAWSTVYAHFRRWTKEGIYAELSQMLPWESTQESRVGAMDSTHVKVHRSGCNPAGGQAAQAIGTSRGGLNTKIHAIVADNGEPLAMSFTGGNNHDNPQAQRLIKAMDTAAGVGTLIADRAYDANATRAAVEAAGCEVCIPPKANRVAPATYDQATFTRRHVVENFWEVLKPCAASRPDTKSSSRISRLSFTSLFSSNTSEVSSNQPSSAELSVFKHALITTQLL